MKRKICASTVAILAAASARVSFGQSNAVPMPYYDPFNYATGNLSGQGQWFRANGVGAPDNQVDNTVNLTYLQGGVGGTQVLPTSTGGSIKLSPAASAPTNRLRLTPQIGAATNATAYYSLSVRIDNLNTVTTTGGIFFANFNDNRDSTALGNITAALRLRKDPTNATKVQVGLDKDGAQAAASLWSNSFTVDTATPGNNPVLFLVVRYKYADATLNTNDQVTLWINPDASTFGQSETGLSATPSVQGTTGTDRVIQAFNLDTRGATDPTKFVDDVRVGTSWASVVPHVWRGATTDTWDSNTSNWYAGNVPDGSGVRPTFMTDASAPHTVHLGTNRTTGGMIFEGSTAYTLDSTGGTLTLATSDAAGPIIDAISGTHTISAQIDGTQGFTKGGGGVLVLTGANTYSGATTISGGTLRATDGVGITGGNLNIAAPSPAGTAYNVFESTSALILRPLGAAAGEVRITSGLSGFSAFGTAVTVDLGGDGSGNGPAITWVAGNFNPSSLVLNGSTANNTIELKNALDLASATARTIAVGANTATMSGIISNSNGTPGGLVKTGAGTLTLTNASNSYGGGTTINGGTLAITSDGVLGALPANPDATPFIKSDGGTLKFLNAFNFGNPLGNRGIQLLPGGLTVDTAGNFVLYTGKIITFSGNDTLTVDSSTGNGTFQMNTSGSSYRSLKLKAGIFSINSDSLLGEALAPKADFVTFDGGTFKTYGALPGTGNNGPNKGITVNAGGGTFDTSGNTATFLMTGAGLTGVVGAGAFNVKGGGTLNVKAIFTPSLTIDGATVGFSSAFTTSTTISATSNNGTVNLGSNNVTAGAVSGAGTLTKSGSGTLTIPSATGGGLTIDGGSVVLTTAFTSASTALGVTSNNGTLDTGSNDVTLGDASGAGALTKAGSGTLEVNHVRARDLDVAQGIVAITTSPDNPDNTPPHDATDPGTSNIASLNIGTGARLDINNNTVVINWSSAGYTSSPLETVRDLIKAGRGGIGFGNGDWYGSEGIVSTYALNDPNGDPIFNFGIGYAQNDLQFVDFYTELDGQPVDGDAILIKLTKPGDANLDGVVNNNDVTILSQFYSYSINENTGLEVGWMEGDFDYDGSVDNDDITYLSQFYDPTATPLSVSMLASLYGEEFAEAWAAGAAMPVPEPTTLGLVSLAGAGMLARRRRKLT